MATAVRVALVVIVVAVFIAVGAAGEELRVGGLNLEGEVESGVRLFLVEPSDSRKGKLEEYRDLPEGLFLERFYLRLFRADESYSSEFAGSKWGQDDQEFALRTGRLGLWQFGFEWDQTPHVYSTTARSLAIEPDRGVFTLPTPRPALPTHSSAPESEISARWDTARIFLDLTPTPDLDLRTEYTRIHKDGDRPFGMAFGSPGNNFYEILEPIDQTTHDVRLRATLAREDWQLQLGYALSLFQNSLSRAIADNPCFANATCGASDGGAAAPPRGQIALPPDNMAHTISLAGGVTLPLRSRLTANASYSLRFQDEPFLPHTINPSISSAALILPQDSLDGMVGVTRVNLNLVSRPYRPLTMTFKYRFFDYNDMSDEPTFPGFVVNDRSLVTEPRRVGRYEYSRHNADADARVRVLRPLTFTLGTGWERWNRNEHREVPTSDEVYAKAALDATPFDWLLARLTYRPSFRRIDTYNTFAHLEHTVEEEGAALQGQSTLLRKFDEGERDRQRIDLMLQLSPLETLTTTLSSGWLRDSYIDSPLGLREATTWSAGVDLNWTPAQRLAIHAGYMHESIFQNQRSRSRPVDTTVSPTCPVPPCVRDFSDFDWASESTDTVETVYLGVSVGLIPKVLDWTASASYAYALGRVQTRNPVTPTSGTAAQDATATAKSLPSFEDQLLRVETHLRYRFSKSWTARLGYVFESFQKNDWRTDNLNPFVPGVTSIWLGNDTRNYAAHLLLVTLGYRFQ